MLNNDRLLNSIVIVLFVVGITCIGYVVFKGWRIGSEGADNNMSCVKDTMIYEMKDPNMIGPFTEGQKLKVLKNFYQCNEVRPGDYVYFNIAPNIPPVVRIVRGVPGDRYSLAEDPQNKGQWLITINNQVIKSGDTPFFIKSNSVPPLRTYELSRKGILAKDEYIILSHNPPGVSDSSNLGLIRRDRLIGKVMAQN